MEVIAMRKFLAVLVMAGALATGIGSGQQKGQQEVALQAAIRKETVEGDLKGAIEQYKKIAAQPGAGRATVATALLRMGQCHEKLGNAEARTAYERVVRDFADQAEIVAQARVRLAALGSPTASAGVRTRQVWTGPPRTEYVECSVSPDGRYLSYVDWDTGDLALHDFVANTDRRLTNKGTWTESDEFAEASAISRDGKQVAYSWYITKDRYELRIVRVEKAGFTQPRRLFGNEDDTWIRPYDWSPDGNWLAVELWRRDRTGQVGLISTQDGSLRVLKSVEWDGSGSALGRIFFSPDGKYLAYDRASDTSRQHDVFILAIDGSRETTAVTGPTQEEMVGWSPDGKYLLFTSDRTGSIGLWTLPFASGTPQGNPELVKPNIGAIVPVGLTAAGALYYAVPAARLLARIQVATFDFGTGKLLSPPVDVAPEGVLESNVSPDWSPDGKYLAYLSQSATGSQGFSIKIRSVETGQVRELPAKLDRLGPYSFRWAPDGRSFSLPQQDGDILRVDAETGETSLLVQKAGVQQGAAPWSPDGKKIYYRRVASDGVAFVERDLASGNETELIRRATLGNVQLSPDGRYIATGSVDPATNSSTFLLIPVAGGEPRELMRAGSKADSAPSMLTWAPDSQSLLIRKRPSGENQSGEVWRALLDGSEARKLDEKLDPRLATAGIRLHPDGRQIAFTPDALTGAGWARSAEVWVLENFLPPLKVVK
jgi:Tol biopolymer transport system component